MREKRPIRYALLVASASALLAFTSSCVRKSEDSSVRDRATRDGILLFGNQGEAPSIDPHLNTTINGMQVTNALMEGLIAYHPTDHNLPEPGVAKSWTHENATVWTFNLRDDARWSNGDPVTAKDFLYSVQRVLEPDFGSNNAYFFYIIKNAKAYNEGTLTDFGEVGVKAPDEHTLVFTLNGPTPHFLNIIKHQAWQPVHPPTIEAAGGMTKPDSNWTRENYVGNGPYKLKEWVVNKIISVEKNPYYWDAEKVSIKEIHFLPIDDISTEDQVFNSGRLHYQNSVPPSLIPIYQKEGDPYLRMEPWVGTYYYILNTTIPALSDSRVRRALSLAINRKAITKRILMGAPTPALEFTPLGIEGYTPPQVEGFDPNKARRLLAEAGYPNGEGFPRLQLLFNSSETHKQIAESVLQMWSSILNIKADLQNQEWKTFLETRTNLDFDIARSGWIGTWAYPDIFLNMFISGGGNNDTGWANPRYDELIELSNNEADPTKRLALLHEAEELLLAESPIIPLYHYSRVYRISPDVKGWYPKLNDNRNYKYLKLEAASPSP
ncbi:peptide ABC transporter substrate-binding protein [Pelagicoccus albus]|uniref:Peptide ABC transporter substrate-binding protein n=1 Tax=Pelagicoccus albus TaxID=415222 RepID=A0A7X1B4S2_9BACT|nr:peptide ABC transporter substrate-binding protein [Pelagicoccus albus]MBC2604513.1 peptide ABC transporter substrate-binding protein [Pelagicoccus albus]